MELDFSFGIRGLARFRCNVFNQRGAVGAVYRLIPEKIRSFGELGLPAVLSTLAERPRGLVLVTGPTGSGKSTTLAAMLDKINAERHDHILTIEDPIEYIHQHKNCLVNQREVHSDTDSFTAALRAALREDPDIVLIGEMRDLETVEAALKIAETGHLTFATLHTNSAAQTINRIIDIFPANQQAQIRTQLSLVLEGIVCQALLPRADGKGPRAVARDPGADAGDPCSDPRRQDAPDLRSDAGRSGEARHADRQPVAGHAVPEATDHARDGASTPRRMRDELQDMINRGVGVVAGRRPTRPPRPRHGVGGNVGGVGRRPMAVSDSERKVRAMPTLHTRDGREAARRSTANGWQTPWMRRSRRCGASRFWSPASRRPGQGRLPPRRRRPARSASGSRPRISRSSPVSSP